MSRYELGAVVYATTASPQRVKERCELCVGAGTFEVGSQHTRKVTCPECHGVGMFRYQRFTTFDVQSLTISDIAERRSTAAHLGRSGKELSEVRYMCAETGTGSGRVYYEDDLFPSGEEAAAAAITAGHLPRGTTPEPIGERS